MHPERHSIVHALLPKYEQIGDCTTRKEHQDFPKDERIYLPIFEKMVVVFRAEDVILQDHIR